jgi:cytochrome P450
MCLLANRPDENGGSACEKALLNHLPTLFAAAFETSQTALTWALFLLAQHPRAAGELLDELSALPDDNPERYASCELLDSIVRESMRLLPSVPSQTRRTSRETDIVDCDVGSGSYVILSAFMTNRDPDLYPEPNRFRPERWRTAKPSQYEYLAFSAGPRTCIGSWFASSLLRIAIARIMRRFRLRVVPDSKIDHQVRLTLRPSKRGLPVVVHAQDGRFEASAIGGALCKIVAFDRPEQVLYRPLTAATQGTRKLRPA